jgi:hypothetical protein
MDVKGMKGLIRKEWVLQRWNIVALVLINLVITILEISPVFAGLFGRRMTEIIISSNTWYSLHLYLGVFLFYTSLINEMKRADIWLHSSASISKLVGAKILVVGFTVTCSFLLSGIIIGLTSYVGGPGAEGLIWQEIFSLLSIIFVLVLNTIFIVIVSYFIWVIYQVLQSRIGKISIIVTTVTVVISIFLWAFVWFSNWFQALKEIGPLLELTRITNGFPFTFEKNFIFLGLLPENALLSVGSLFLYALFSLALFIGGSALFEKKVRL